MELELALSLLFQALPSIAEIFTAFQEEKIVKLKHQYNQENPENGGISQNSLEFHNLRFEKEKSLQQQLAAYDRETQLKLADFQRETALKTPEVNQILEHWPLRLFPSQLLNSFSNNQQSPLRIFLSPPQVQVTKFSEIEQAIPELELNISQSLSEFLNKNYPLNSQTRATEFLAGAWERDRFHKEASIKALFAMLKSEPTLILESEIIGNYLSFRIAYWGLGQKKYCYKTIISKLNYRQIIYASVKNRALRWKETANQLLACGESPEEVNKLGGDNAINLEILLKEEKWKACGVDTSDLVLNYKVNSQDFEEFYQFLTICHCLVAGWVADAYYLLQYGVTPLLPELLPYLLQTAANQQLIQEVIQTIFSSYQEIFKVIEIEKPLWLPEITLKLAQNLANFPDTSWIKEQLHYSLQTWLNQRKLLQIQTNSRLEMAFVLTIDEKIYLENLKNCFIKLGDEQGVTQVNSLLLAAVDIQPNLELESSNNSIILIETQPLKAQITSISLTQTITENSGKNVAIALKLDNYTLASVSDENIIKLRDLNSGEIIHTFKQNTGRVLGICVSKDGEIIASSNRTSDRSCINIWNLPTGELLRTLNGHKKWVYSLAISPDSKTLISGGHKIKVWDLRSGELIQALNGHKKWVYSLAISPDGQSLVSSGGDKTIKVWHLKTGELLCMLTGHLDWVRTVAISPDNSIIASGSDDKTIKIWDLTTGKLLRTLSGHSDWVLSVAISPDSKTLISGSKDNTIKLWNLETGTLLRTLSEHQKPVYSLAITPDGQAFASGSEDKTIKIWRNLS